MAFAPLILGEAVLLITGDRRALSAAFIASRAEADSVFGNIARVGAAAFIGIGAAAAIGIGASINMAKNLEFAISAAGAVGEATVDQLKQMRELAISLSKESIYGATEIAQAMEILLKAGADVEQVLGGAAKSVIVLAQAGGTTLDIAADIIATSLTVFRGSAEDTEDWINRIAAASNKSRFDVAGLSAAIGQGAAAAELAGVSFADFMAYIGLTAASFNSASQSGTTFKVFLQRLNPVAKTAQKELARVGIITAESGNAFFDAAGEIRPMAEIIDVLRAAYADMTPEDAIKSLTQVFGTRGYKAAAALIGLTSEEFLEFKRISGDTSAEDLAAERLNNLQGSLLKLWRTTQAVGLDIGKFFTEKLNLRGGVDAITTNVPRMAIGFQEGLTGVDNPMQGGDWGPAVNAATEFGRVLREDVLPPAREFSTWMLNSAIPALTDFAVNDAWPVMKTGAGVIRDDLVPAIKSIGEFLAPVIGWLSKHKELVGAAIIMWTGYKLALMAVAAVQMAQYLTGVLIAANNVRTTIGLLTAVQWLWNTALLANPIGLVIVGIAALIAIGYLLYKNWDVISEAAQRLWNHIKESFGEWAAFIGEQFSRIQTHFIESVAAWTSFGGNLVDGLRRGVAEKWDGFINWFKQRIDDLPSWAKRILGIDSPSKVMAEIGKNMMEGLANGIRDGSGRSLKEMRDLMEALEEEMRLLRIQKAQASLAGANDKTLKAYNDQLEIYSARIAMLRDEIKPLTEEEKKQQDAMKDTIATMEEYEKGLVDLEEAAQKAYVEGGIAAYVAKRNELLVMDALWQQEIENAKKYGIELTNAARKTWEDQKAITESMRKGILTGNWQAAVSAHGAGGVGYSWSGNVGGVNIGIGGAAKSAQDASTQIANAILRAGGSLQQAADAINQNNTLGGNNLINVTVNEAHSPSATAQAVTQAINFQLGEGAAMAGVG